MLNLSQNKHITKLTNRCYSARPNITQLIVPALPIDRRHLRRHPIRRPNETAPLVDSRRNLRRHTKVGQLHVALLGQQNVGALDVAVHFAHRVQILEALQRLAAHVRDLLLAERSRHLVDVLQAAAAAVLHADPQLVAPQVRAKVGDDVRVPTVAHHDDLLLDHLDVIAGLNFDHFYGGQLVALDAFCLRAGKEQTICDIGIG